MFFRRARWVVAAWLLVWVPCYAVTWGWRNFLSLCDVAVIVACAGFWSHSRLLLSSQALPAICFGLLWVIDVAGRFVVGHHVLGGTEYMFDNGSSLLVRLLSLFHIALPIALIAALRRTGYDRRGLPLQAGLTLLVMIASRFVAHEKNLNFAFADPIFGWAWGPAPLHVFMVTAGMVVLTYLPTHLVLVRVLPRPPR